MDIKNLKYPIYIVSKGRWDRPLTARFLMKEEIPFLMAVEPQEFDKYAQSIGEKNLLKLPFANLGQGSYPARNHCWEHSVSRGDKKHFIFDDNIYGFVRFNQGLRKKTLATLAIQTLQEFSDQYSNLAISGFNYRYFVDPSLKKPFFINTHVYSAMLIRNDLDFRWRLKYNEDVDLCLQALQRKYCTILLNVFLINKVSTTAKMKGGNQSELYQDNNEIKKLLKSRSLEQVWPQYVNVVQRFGRTHHQISWNKHFKHPLKRSRLRAEINI